MKTNLFRACAAVLGIALLATGFTGCVGYKLGSMLPKDIATCYIPIFVNKTDEPLIEVRATQATIEEFQRDGSLRIVSLEDADAVLTVKLIDYDLSPISFVKNRETKANEYRITLTASIMLTRKATDEVLVEDPAVRGESTIKITGDLSSAKRRGLPRAAEDLAHDIVERVVETWQ